MTQLTRAILAFSLVASLAGSREARAQSSQPAAGGSMTSDVRPVARQLRRSAFSTAGLDAAKLPIPADAKLDAVAQQPEPGKRRSGLVGGLIGLAAGTVVAGLYWNNSNCRYGSDSFSAVTTHCIVPSGGLIAGGWLIGRSVGR